MNTVQITVHELEEMLDRAAQKGARAALEELGLHDETAGDDMRDIRNLLSVYRSAKNTIFKQILQTMTIGVLFYIAMAVYLYSKQNLNIPPHP